MFERIVIGFDGTPQGDDALALARALAGPTTALVVVCVHPRDFVAARVVAAGAAAEAQRRLDLARDTLGDRPGAAFVAVPATSAAAGLHAVAEAEDADLIVAGSSHRGAVGRVLPGTTTAQVLHAAPCAVAAAPVGLHARGVPALRRIGAGFDGGEEARRALRAAHALAADNGAELHAVTVVDRTARVIGAGGSFSWPHDVLELAQERLRAAVSELGDGVPVETLVLTGSPVTELAVASVGLDLLVLGSRGYGPLRRVLLGSVAAGVAGSAACPLLVVPRGAA